MYPMAGWVRDWAIAPRTGVAQIPTLAKWGVYLELRSALSTSPLSQTGMGQSSHVDKELVDEELCAMWMVVPHEPLTICTNS